MKTIKQVIVEPVFVKFIPDNIEQGKLYISEEYGTAIHLCLCGCGLETVTPIRGRYSWELIKHKDGKISLTPSIGNYRFSCKSHYILTKNIANFI